MEQNMSDALRTLERDVITAMKAGDRTRLDILRMFVNKAKMTAKNDGNRPPEDRDVLTAGLKMVKEANETRDLLLSNGREVSVQDNEITVVSEYLPKQMSEGELRSLLEGLKDQAPEGKGARGFFMKVLNTDYKGQFDPRAANAIVEEITTVNP
jgi:uncharacterized protein YqeY